MNIDWENIRIKDLAGLICRLLKENGIEVVLVGGACVSIYSVNKYLSHDLDFVMHASVKEVEPIMKKVGFSRKSGRHFEHPRCPFFVEFLAPPVAIGETPLNRFESKRTKYGMLQLLILEDSIKDRLAAYYHWNDPQSLDQALILARMHRKNVDLKAVEVWSRNEGHEDKFEKFINLLKS